MRTIRVAVATMFVVAAIYASVARGSSYSIDQSDLWWNPSESGWGIQLVQRGSLIFATMFVYASNGSPTWYTALLSPSGPLAWSGDLYATTGTWFGAPVFNPMATMPTKVGTMTWAAANATSGTLTYTVNGVAVAKEIVREFIVFDDFSGTFQGGFHDTITGCTDMSKNGSFDDYASVTITQTGQNLALTLTTQTLGLACTFTGTLSQDGRFGSASGTFNCNGKMTNGTLSSVVVGPDSISTHFGDTNPNGCISSGYFAGARHN
jgi:hypothetical protein